MITLGARHIFRFFVTLHAQGPYIRFSGIVNVFTHILRILERLLATKAYEVVLDIKPNREARTQW